VREHRRLVTVTGEIHNVPLLAQALLDKTGDLPVIFDDEDPHRSISIVDQ
jgi:hypothetical protein